MRVKIQKLLYKAVNEFELDYRETEGRKWFGLKSFGASLFNVFGKIRNNVPQITEQVLGFLENPENRDKIKEFIRKKIDEYADKTFSKTDYSQVELVIEQLDASSLETAKSTLNLSIEETKEKESDLIIIVATGFLLIIGMAVFSKSFQKEDLLLLNIYAFILLIIGVALPMIEIDARISTLSFKLLGEDVVFEDQVLYYKSKSILEVVSLMINHKKIEMKLVGLLVLIFSVVFPLAKLFTTIGYLYLEKIRDNKIVKFIVFKIGKWSMADVMVIAIFMAYIGFSGIINEQMAQLEKVALSVDILTTNNSNLLLAFYSFTGFVIISLITSYKLQALKS
ncbi:MAG: paraquat-inducible protein A [Cytophagales bacterium]